MLIKVMTPCHADFRGEGVGEGREQQQRAERRHRHQGTGAGALHDVTARGVLETPPARLLHIAGTCRCVSDTACTRGWVLLCVCVCVCVCECCVCVCECCVCVCVNVVCVCV